jgi:hypothetical protein
LELVEGRLGEMTSALTDAIKECFKTKFNELPKLLTTFIEKLCFKDASMPAFKQLDELMVAAESFTALPKIVPNKVVGKQNAEIITGMCANTTALVTLIRQTTSEVLHLYSTNGTGVFTDTLSKFMVETGAIPVNLLSSLPDMETSVNKLVDAAWVCLV